MTDPPPTDAEQPIGLDLVAPEMYAPVLRRFVLVAAGLALLAGIPVGVLFGPLAGVVVAFVIAVPVLVSVLAARRRRLWLHGSILHARTLWRTRQLDVPAVTGVELLVYSGRVSRSVLRLTGGTHRCHVPLAMYTAAGSGRELHLLGLRRLADALARSELAAGVAVADLLVHQLRAEARDAALADRPLYRAVTAASHKAHVAPVVLTDAQIADLV